MNIEPFLKPRFTGARFEGGVVPLHVLADFAILEQMIVDVAKWKFRSCNPLRRRVPRGFTDGISLKLTGVEKGSAVPVISLCFPTTHPLPMVVGDYFKQAITAIVGAIREAELGLPITGLSPRMLGYFARFGRSLEPGEAVIFEDAAGESQAHLTQKSRHRLVIASTVNEYTGDVVLHGTVPEIDQENRWFQIGRIDGTRVRTPLTETIFETVMEAFNHYASGAKVRLYATGRFDRDQKLKGIESVEQVIAIDPLDIRARVEELKHIREGWLEGKGKVPPPDTLDWIAATFEERFPNDLRLPYLFPTPAGRILAEWSLGPWALSLEIDPVAQRGSWHALNTISDEESEREINLAVGDDWTRFAEEVRAVGGVAE